MTTLQFTIIRRFCILNTYILSKLREYKDVPWRERCYARLVLNDGHRNRVKVKVRFRVLAIALVTGVRLET